MVYLQAGQQLQLSPGLSVCCTHCHHHPLVTSPPDGQTDRQTKRLTALEERCPVLTYYPARLDSEP